MRRTRQRPRLRSERNGADAFEPEALTGLFSAPPWLRDLGVSHDAAANATKDASSALSSGLPALLEGVAGGLKRLSSLVFFLSLTALSLFFLLKDGPQIRTWAERNMRVPAPMTHQMSG